MENEVLTDRELAIRLLAEALGVTRPMAAAHFDCQRERFPSPPDATVLTAVPCPAEVQVFEPSATPAAAAIEEPTTLDEPETIDAPAAEEPHELSVSPDSLTAAEQPAETPTADPAS